MMTALDSQDFQAVCGCERSALKVNYQGLEFRRGPSFAIALHQKALEFCETCLIDGTQCLLVQDACLVTVWIESAAY
jgi:hypothetical protein